MTDGISLAAFLLEYNSMSFLQGESHRLRERSHGGESAMRTVSPVVLQEALLTGILKICYANLYMQHTPLDEKHVPSLYLQSQLIKKSNPKPG